MTHVPPDATASPAASDAAGSPAATHAAADAGPARRSRWLVVGVPVAAVALLAGAAAFVVPWWQDGNAAPAHARLAAGRGHTCALTDAGEVRCWGDNAYGQLGDGTTTPRTSAVAVEGLGDTAVALSGSGNHTCALTTAGAVRCWGDNAYGQLGNATTTASAVPVDVQGLGSGVLAVSAGPSHTCALTAAREVQCWGANGSSQLGTGDSVDRNVPAAVADLPSRVTDVSVGNGFTCVVFTGRTLRCWGDNGDGQLGLGDTTPRLSWEPITALPRTSSVSAGDTHACSVTRDGAVWCWGANWAGQVGAGEPGVSSLVPQQVSAVADARLVAAGYEGTCALTASGTVTCWGAAGSRDVEGLEAPDAVAVGAFHACATSGVGVRCWGSNTNGQLGDGTTDDSEAPVEVAGL